MQVLDYTIKQAENADTLDGQHASDFASATDMSAAQSDISNLQAKVGDTAVSEQISSAIANKVDKVNGKDLSTNDYTTAEKDKLAGIAEGANKTIVDSALSSTSTNPVQNQVVNSVINNLNTLVGTTSVSTQINNAVANKAEKTTSTATISTDWIGDTAPYTQDVAVSGLLATDNPHIAPVYSANFSTAVLEREAWNMVGYASCDDGVIRFVCFEDKPTTAINVLIEVIR